MSKQDNLTDFLTDVADAIREKKGTTDLINPQDFSEEIRNIKSGGDMPTAEWNDVNFYDYEGTILYSYTWDEFVAKNEMPPLPTHREKEGLICQEWNYTLEEVLEQGGRCDVGAIYDTADGCTHIRLRGGTVTIRGLVSNGSITIDWGDGNTTTVSNGQAACKHKYASRGNYIIRIDLSNGDFSSVGFSGFSEVEHIHIAPKISFRQYAITSISKPFSVSLSRSNLARQTPFLFSEGRIKHLNLPKGTIGDSPISIGTSIPLISIPCKSSGISTIYYGNTPNDICIPTTSATSLITDSWGRASVSSLFISKACPHLRLTKAGITDLSGEILYCGYNYSDLSDIIRIEKNSLSNLGVNTIVFPANLGYIGPYALAGKVVIYDFSNCIEVPVLSETGGIDLGTTRVAIVRKSIEDAWKSATNWSKFASRIKGVVEPIYFNVNAYDEVVDKGMTWGDFIEQGFNTQSYTISNGEVKQGNTSIKYQGVNVLATDTIIQNADYTL